MELVLGDVLKRLCVEIGWSYAVFWKAVGLEDQMYLIWEDGYCERMHGGISGFEAMDLLIKEKGLLRGSRCEERFAELGRSTEDRVFTLVHKRMASQVHVVGDGVVGKAASTGNHQWILQGNLNQIYLGTKDLVEINQQLLAGIQTIAVIPLLPFGVLQLGSTQLIFEESGFVNYAQHLLIRSGSMTGTHLCDASDAALYHKSQLSSSTRPSFNRFGDVISNVNASLSRSFHGKDKIFRCHDSITKTSSVLTSSSLYKEPVPSQQMSLDSNISSKEMLPLRNFSRSTCHVVNPNHHPNSQLESECRRYPGTFSASHSRMVEKTLPHHSSYENHRQPVDVNTRLFPGCLKSLENQFSTYYRTTHDSVDNHEAMAESSKLLHRRTLESKLSNSLECSESASSFGRSSSSSNKAVNIVNSSLLSSGTKECIKSQISFNNKVSQIQSLTNDLDRVHMLSCGFSRTYTGKNSVIVSALGKEKDGNLICQALDEPMAETSSCAPGNRSHHSSNRDGWYDFCSVSANKQHPNDQHSVDVHDTEVLPPSSIETTFDLQQQHSESILFDLFDLDQVSNANYSILDDSFVNLNSIEVCSDLSNDEISFGGGIFSENGSDQLLDAIVSQVKPSRMIISDNNVSCNTASTKTSNISLHNSPAQCNAAALLEKLPGNSAGQFPVSTKTHIAGTNTLKYECSIDKSGEICFHGDEKSKSQISLWLGKAKSMNSDGMSAANCKRIDKAGNKLNRKRSRAGENPRPRPKDRQMIQDRVKELREIVPNGAKMSIDALLEKTIKHMLFLQSVTKHADKLKETGKPKIIGDEEGLLIKGNFDGGATWAFEVGSQSVICPIVVEDLSTPRHMLVEMLCEKRGLFLEIADLIRGLGLTILKGVMEARDDKVWARFAVEANKDVTRMEVFLSLVHLLEPTAGNAVLEGVHNCKQLTAFDMPTGVS